MIEEACFVSFTLAAVVAAKEPPGEIFLQPHRPCAQITDAPAGLQMPEKMPK